MTRFHRWLCRQPPIVTLLIAIGVLILASRFQGDFAVALVLVAGFFLGAGNMKMALRERLDRADLWTSGSNPAADAQGRGLAGYIGKPHRRAGGSSLDRDDIEEIEDRLNSGLKGVPL